MAKSTKIEVKGIEVAVKRVGNSDNLSLTDMLKAKEGEFFVKSWFRNRNTIEFLGIREQVHNPNFNWYEFDLIRKEAGLNNFSMSVETLISSNADRKTEIICLCTSRLRRRCTINFHKHADRREAC